MAAPGSPIAASSHAPAPLATDPEAALGIALRRSVEAVERRIRAACAAAGRDRAEIRLVAVSKFHPAAAVEAARRAGLRSFGENRVQEAARKFGPAPRADGPVLHLIGRLQTNKAGDAVRIADVIEVLDRPRLLDSLDAAVQAAGRCPQLLIQVNVGAEPQKGGIAEAEAGAFIEACRTRFGASVQGLMCVPPADADPAPHFARLATLARAHGLSTLSMGMSDDLEAAVAAGSTCLRIGTAIFGPRPPGGDAPATG